MREYGVHMVQLLQRVPTWLRCCCVRLCAAGESVQRRFLFYHHYSYNDYSYNDYYFYYLYIRNWQVRSCADMFRVYRQWVCVVRQIQRVPACLRIYHLPMLDKADSVLSHHHHHHHQQQQQQQQQQQHQQQQQAPWC